MATIEVGKPYGGQRRKWPETVEYLFASGGHWLRMFFAGPSEVEVEAIAVGACEFALYLEGPVIVFCCRFGGEPWSDASYTWHLVPPERRDLPSADLEANARALLRVVLVDARDGTVRALRLVTLDHDFTTALHSAIRAQAAQPWDERAYDRALARIYAGRSSDWLAKHAAVRTIGGQ